MMGLFPKIIDDVCLYQKIKCFVKKKKSDMNKIRKCYYYYALVFLPKYSI